MGSYNERVDSEGVNSESANNETEDGKTAVNSPELPKNIGSKKSSVQELIKKGVLWKVTSHSKITEDKSKISFIEKIAKEGLPCGSIHEFSFDISTLKSSRRIPPFTLITYFLSRVCSQKPGKALIVWIGKDLWPTPYLLQKANALENSIFINPPNEKLRLWAIETALRSPAVAGVVADGKNFRFSLTRRFALAATKSQAVGFFMRPLEELLSPSASFSKWKISSSYSDSSHPWFQLELVTIKGEEPPQKKWTIELSYGVNNEALSFCIPPSLAFPNYPAANYPNGNYPKGPQRVSSASYYSV